MFERATESIFSRMTEWIWEKIGDRAKMWGIFIADWILMLMGYGLLRAWNWPCILSEKGICVAGFIVLFVSLSIVAGFSVAWTEHGKRKQMQNKNILDKEQKQRQKQVQEQKTYAQHQKISQLIRELDVLHKQTFASSLYGGVLLGDISTTKEYPENFRYRLRSLFGADSHEMESIRVIIDKDDYITYKHRDLAHLLEAIKGR